MSYIALYREWRPRVFEDVVEQEHVVRSLRNSIKTGRIAHAYLFCGTRGTGKTTLAHIFSRAINCLNPNGGDPCNQCDICRGIISGSILDVIEIDAASNNSVDDVRTIRDEVVYTPSQAKYKVYIIDEVHMLSTGAFNALLKTLEEPPAHVVFILATTEPHKLPATILSRCQRYDFRRISLDSIIGRLTQISEAGGVTLQPEAARLIARMSEGAMRDAISILDQCISMGGKDISYDEVLSVIGVVNDTFIGDVVDALIERNSGTILEQVENLVMGGKDIKHFSSELVFYFRNLLICKITQKPEEVIEVPTDTMARMKNQCTGFSQDEIIYMIKELSQLEAGLKWATYPRVMLEVSLIKLAESRVTPDREDLLARLEQLEKKLESGEFTVRAASREPAPAPAVKAAEAGEGRKPESKPVKEEVKKDGKAGFSGKTLDCWKDILTELRSSGRMVLYTNLMDAKAVELDSKVVGLVFPADSGFSKMIVTRPEHQEVITGVLSKKLGREVRVKCLAEEEFTERQAEKPQEKDELLEKAEDLAKRLNVPLNIIDE